MSGSKISSKTVSTSPALNSSKLRRTEAKGSGSLTARSCHGPVTPTLPESQSSTRQRRSDDLRLHLSPVRRARDLQPRADPGQCRDRGAPAPGARARLHLHELRHHRDVPAREGLGASAQVAEGAE